MPCSHKSHQKLQVDTKSKLLPNLQSHRHATLTTVQWCPVRPRKACPRTLAIMCHRDIHQEWGPARLPFHKATSSSQQWKLWMPVDQEIKTATSSRKHLLCCVHWSVLEVCSCGGSGLARQRAIARPRLDWNCIWELGCRQAVAVQARLRCATLQPHATHSYTVAQRYHVADKSLPERRLRAFRVFKDCEDLSWRNFGSMCTDVSERESHFQQEICKNAYRCVTQQRCAPLTAKFYLCFDDHNGQQCP